MHSRAEEQEEPSSFVRNLSVAEKGPVASAAVAKSARSAILKCIVMLAKDALLICSVLASHIKPIVCNDPFHRSRKRPGAVGPYLVYEFA